MNATTRWDWSLLRTSVGDGSELPGLVARLHSDDAEVRRDAFRTTYARVANQRDLRSGAAAVVDLLLTRLEGGGRLFGDAWFLLNEIYLGSAPGEQVVVDEERVGVEDYVRARVLSSSPHIRRAFAAAAPEELEDMQFLLMAMAGDSREVVEWVEQEAAAAAGERAEFLAGLVPEVREAWEERDG
ncbi:hypothetical protein ACFV4N_36980 [Actinosynnema sp. NPDC059797]